jgi:membrane-bound lytic murein transglycosylase D
LSEQEPGVVLSFFSKLINRIALYVLVPVLFLVGFILLADQQKEKLDSVSNYVSEKVLFVINCIKYATHENLFAETPPQRKVEVREVIKASEVKKETAKDDDVNKIPLEFVNQAVTADDILHDKLNLVQQDFKVQQDMRERVGFWFDIYTKYTSHFVVIHDSYQPWIIYRVVDLREIYSRHISRIAKDIYDKRAIAKAKLEVRATLLSLSNEYFRKNLSGEKLRIAQLFSSFKGNKKQLFLRVAREMREQRGQKDFFRKGVIYSSRYLSEMEEIFARYDLPVELVRLPLVESSFDEAAESKVGASGIWQFMPGMGKKYLRVGDFVDERNSPIKATEAAAKLMLSNFRILKTWPLAVSAYNHGAGGLIKASRLFKTKNLADLITNFKSKSFSFASQNFYSEFLAALYGEKYQDDVFGALAKYPPLPGETYSLHRKMRAKTLVDIIGITMEELKLFNPDLRKQTIAGFTFLPVGYHVRVPIGRKARLEIYFQESAKTTDDKSDKST